MTLCAGDTQRVCVPVRPAVLGWEDCHGGDPAEATRADAGGPALPARGPHPGKKVGREPVLEALFLPSMHEVSSREADAEGPAFPAKGPHPGRGAYFAAGGPGLPSQKPRTGEEGERELGLEALPSMHEGRIQVGQESKEGMAFHRIHMRSCRCAEQLVDKGMHVCVHARTQQKRARFRVCPAHAAHASGQQQAAMRTPPPVCMQLAHSTEVLVLPSPSDKEQGFGGPAASASACKTRASSGSTAAPSQEVVSEDSGGAGGVGDREEGSGAGSSASEDDDEEASEGGLPHAGVPAAPATAAAAEYGPNPAVPHNRSRSRGRARQQGQVHGESGAAASGARGAPIPTPGSPGKGASVRPAVSAGAPVPHSIQAGKAAPGHAANACVACPPPKPAAAPVALVKPSLSASTQPLCQSLMEAAAAAAAGGDDGGDEAQSGELAGCSAHAQDARYVGGCVEHASGVGGVGSVHVGEEADTLVTQLMMEAIDAGTEGGCAAAARNQLEQTTKYAHNGTPRAARVYQGRV